MNKCHFLGKLTHDPETEPFSNTRVCRFVLEVEEYRKRQKWLKEKKEGLFRF